jgi:hypothetical protein
MLAFVQPIGNNTGKREHQYNPINGCHDLIKILGKPGENKNLDH